MLPAVCYADEPAGGLRDAGGGRGFCRLCWAAPCAFQSAKPLPLRQICHRGDQAGRARRRAAGRLRLAFHSVSGGIYPEFPTGLRGSLWERRMAWAAWATAAKSITCLLLTGRRTGCARSRWRLSVSTFSRLFLEAENLGWLCACKRWHPPSPTLPRGGAGGTPAAEARSAPA